VRYRGNVAELSEDSGAPPLIVGFDWMLSCTTDFESTLAFVRDVLGMKVFKQGIAETDRQFARYACAALPSGDVLEVVEPVQPAVHVRGKQILCLAVRDFLEARRELERRGAVFASDIFHKAGVGWIYVRAPGGNIYQIYGPFAGEDRAGSSGPAHPQ
jgi:catechol 2,3-dioxygenase-like lactoylglutathione lyase family enzyme